MSPTLLLLFVFCATFALVVVGLYFATNLLKLTVRTDEHGNLIDGNAEAGDGGPLLLRKENVSSISFWAELLERFHFSQKLRRLIGDAGLGWSVGRFTSMMLLGGASTAVLLSRIEWLPLVGVGVGGVFGISAPFLYVRSKKAKRFSQFDEHFPDALDSLGRAMRAGHSLSAGMELVAYEAAQPVSGELRKVLEEWRLGRSWDQALENFVERIPLLSVSQFAAAVRMQSRTGGKLHEILARISEGLRDSSSLDGEIRAISAHGKLTGGVLTALPIGIALTLNYTAPGHLDILVQNPVGRYLIVTAVVFLIAAHFVIRKILDIRI